MSSKFTHIGMSNIVQNDRVIAVIPLGTVTAKRYKEAAKKSGKIINAELGREVKSMLILDDGTVITSCIKPKTLMGRLNGIVGAEQEDPEEEEAAE